jgi:flagellar biosynthesis/type III secretory pathway M-ring protein FliF/YscJ
MPRKAAMDFLKNHFARLQQQFNQLSASQKMLTMSLMAIMIMTLVWWGRYAGQAEMEPVLEQDFAPEDIARVTGDLRSKGIAYSISGARILVPTDRKMEALGSLIYQDMLPHDSATPLLELMNKSTSAFDSGSKTDMIANEGRQAYLAMIIHTFPQVRHAMVALAVPAHRVIDGPNSPSATVNIQLKPGGKPDNRLATAAADVIVGAISGMNRSNVHVIVDGVARPVAPSGSDEDGGSATGYMDQVRDEEKYYSDQITAQFGFVDGVMVHVNVLPKIESSESKENTFNQKGAFSKENESESETTSSGGANHTGGDPGVNSNTAPNQGMSVTSGEGGGGAGSNMEKTHSKSTVFVPGTEVVKRSPSGSCTIQSASVAFPRSYFVKTYQIETQTDKAPSATLLDPYIKQQLDKFKTSVKAYLHIDSDTAIAVDTYTELQPIEAESPTQMTSGVTMMLGSHVREIALGALALMSLFMVQMIVRKSSSPAMLAGAGIGGAGGMVDGVPAGATVDAMLAKAVAKANDVTAEVGEGGQTLDGVELDEESLRNQQVLEQVSTLVKDNPDAAANLIKRWMNRA